MRVDICTACPDALRGYLEKGLPGLAAAEAIAEFQVHDYRCWGKKLGVYAQTSQRKLLRAGPVLRCVRYAQAASPAASRVILLSPRGQRLTQRFALRLARLPRLILVCGRFGGFESPVYDALDAQQVSVGNYVLHSGEVAAMVILDTVIRLLPGTLPCMPGRE